MAYISFQPSDFFNVNLWTGNSTTDRAMTGIGFQPDFLWNKSRNETYDHHLQDAVRGSTTYIDSNDTGINATNAEGVKSFNADGFTLGNANDWNQTAKTYVGWSWKAGTTTGIVTTGSTITPTGYSFNQTSGFSVIAYTGNATAGATIPHGLGVAPDMILVKNTQTAEAWACYFKPLGNTKVLTLNATNAELTQAQWNNTSPTSTLFSVGSGGNTNLSQTHVAYCFANKKGYSKMGSYTGNGNADGTFVYTGFRPAYVMIKASSIAGDSWNIYDDKRPSTYEGNVVTELLEADTGNATLTNASFNIDILSNGFKCKGNESGINQNAAEYIFAAFAEFPLVSSNSKAGTAR